MRGQSYTNNNTHKGFQGGETKVMKKSLLSLLIIALVFTMAVPAFANTAVNEDLGEYAVAVERLGALDILKGYAEDGTFRVNNTITRAEFAAVAVRLLGLEGAAQASTGSTQFKDPVAQWATGYINVAAQQGILNGYEDGTIRANNPVTQAEALAMLVRVLGYDPSVAKTGWPYNYIVKAQEIGLISNMSVTGNAPATRGFVALASDNALFIDKMVAKSVVGGQLSYEVDKNNTLLRNNLGATETKGQLTGVYFLTGGSALASGTFEVTTDATVNPTREFTIPAGTPIADMLLKDVTVWSKNNKVLYVSATNPGTAVTGTIDTISASGNLKFVGSNTLYSIDGADAVIDYVVGDETLLAPGQHVTIYHNNRREIVAAVGFHFTNANATAHFFEELTSAGNAFLKDSSTISKDKVYIKDGKIVTVDDLVENDVVYTFGDVVYVVNKTVTGTFNRHNSNNSYQVGGTNYTTLTEIYFSEDKGATFEQKNRSNSSAFLGETVTVYLDGQGRVFGLSAGESNVAAVNYAYFTGDKQSTVGKYYAEFVTSDNKKAFHEISRNQYNDLPGTGIGAGQVSAVVNLQFRADGSVSSVSVLNSAVNGAELNKTATSNYVVRVNGTAYSVSTDAVVFDGTTAHSWLSLRSALATSGNDYEGNVYLSNGATGVVTAIVLTKGTVSVAQEGALVVSWYTDSEGKKVELNIAGEVKVFKATDINFSGLTRGGYVNYTVSGNELVSVTDATYFIEEAGETVKFEVRSFNSNSGALTVVNVDDADDVRTFFLHQDAVIYTVNNSTVAFSTRAQLTRGKQLHIELLEDSDDIATLIKITN